jgi:hypothetical protein
MKILALSALIFLTGCTSIEKVATIQNNKLELTLSDKIIQNVSKVKALYDLALIARGLI